MSIQLNKNIIKQEEVHNNSDASEKYIEATFKYNDKDVCIWVPIEYRRTGINYKTEDEINKYLNSIYDMINPANYAAWLERQKDFWKTKQAPITKSFFDALIRKGVCKWVHDFPENPNPQRRIQYLKDFGYTISTKRVGNITHRMILPIDRADSTGNGYETWTPRLRNRILRVLGNIDVYENTKHSHCLPDHKFPEIRWDQNTKSINPDDMSDEDIKSKFQLLTNQRNQQKRECCRICYQTGKRPCPFGINFFYKGSEEWDEKIPAIGKEAEQGCVGCGWYDFAEWRTALNKKLKK